MSDLASVDLLTDEEIDQHIEVAVSDPDNENTAPGRMFFKSCQKCKRPTLGHKKPTGINCGLSEASAEEIKDITDKLQEQRSVNRSIHKKANQHHPAFGTLPNIAENDTIKKLATAIQKANSDTFSNLMENLGRERMEEERKRKEEQAETEALRKEEREERERIRKEEREERERIRREEMEERKSIREEEWNERERTRIDREREETNRRNDENRRRKDDNERIFSKEQKFPKWGKEEEVETFKVRVEIWEQSSKLKPGQKLIELLESMEENKKEEKRRLEIETIGNTGFDKEDKDILKNCFKIIEKFCDKSKLEKIVENWRNFCSLKQGEDEDINAYIRKFESIEIKLKNLEVKMPNNILAIQLLDGSKLNPAEKRVILSKTNTSNDEIYKTVKDAIREMKSALVEGEKKEAKAFYTNDYPRGRFERSKSRDKYPDRDRSRSRSRGRFRRSRSRSRYENREKDSGRRSDAFKRYRDKYDKSSSREREDKRSRSDRSPNHRNYYTASDNEVIIKNWEGGNENINGIFYSRTINKALIDCACSKTCAGESWINTYYDSLEPQEKSKISHEDEKVAFKFGPSKTYFSHKNVKIPLEVKGRVIDITISIVKADVPLLLGNDLLEHQLEAVIDLKKRIFTIGSTGETYHIEKTNTGHFAINIAGNKFINTGETVEKVYMTENITYDEKVKKIKKIHKILGHPKPDKLIESFRRAGDDEPRTVDAIREISEECDVCFLSQKPGPRPKVAMPKSCDFNQVVSLDLKDRKKSHGKYVLYMIDEFSGLTKASVIPNKEPKTVIDALYKTWILGGGLGPGFPEKIFHDNGGEFVNAEMIELASKANMKIDTTAALSGWMNGKCERNHFTADNTVDKLMMEDEELSLEEATELAVYAKNCAINHLGFSAFQIVYGKNPVLPGVENSTPATLDYSNKHELVRKILNRLNNARRDFQIADSSNRLKKALSVNGSKFLEKSYQPGETVYFWDQDTSQWSGPAKILAQDSRVVFIKIGGYRRSVPTCRVIPLGEHFNLDFNNKNIDSNVVSNAEIISTNDNISIIDTEREKDDDREAPPKEKPEITITDDYNEDTTAKTNHKLRPKKGATVRFRLNDDWRTGKVKSVGKKEGKHQNTCWIEDKEGSVEAINFERIDEWQVEENKVYFSSTVMRDFQEEEIIEEKRDTRIDREKEKSLDIFGVARLKIDDKEVGNNNTNQVFVTIIPQNRHKEPECVLAKEKELEKWDQFEAFEEVPDEGQKAVSSRWVIVEKDGDTEGTKKVKGRLCVRGFEEDDKPQSDSPTAARETLKIIAFISANEKWKLESYDVTSAFLQGKTLERNIFMKPPKERETQGYLWKLKKACYGLYDGSRKWFLATEEELLRLGCVKCTKDEAVFFYRLNNKLEGIIALHVDDFLTCGSKTFTENVMNNITKTFVFGKITSDNIKFTGIKMETRKESIILHQHEYTDELSEVNIDNTRDVEDELNKKEKFEFRGVAGKINWLQLGTRPDLAIDGLEMSMKNNSAKVKDLKNVNKIIRKAKKNEVSIAYPKLGDWKKLHIRGFADASYATQEDSAIIPGKIKSVRGNIVFICNESGDSAPLFWKSKTISKVVTCVKSAETHAAVEGIQEAEYFAEYMYEIYSGEPGSGEKRIPIDFFIDSKTLHDSLYSTKQINDTSCRTSVGKMKQDLQEGRVRSIQHVKSPQMLADCLTKATANSGRLRAILAEGKQRKID